MPRITKLLGIIEEQIRMRQREVAFDYTEVQLCFIIGHIVGVIMEEELKEKGE